MYIYIQSNLCICIHIHMYISYITRARVCVYTYTRVTLGMWENVRGLAAPSPAHRRAIFRSRVHTIHPEWRYGSDGGTRVHVNHYNPSPPKTHLTRRRCVQSITLYQHHKIRTQYLHTCACINILNK